MQKYEAAISDTDILINLAKVGKLKLLELIFSKIYIPIYVYEKELKRKAGRYFSVIEQEINSANTIFKVIDRKEDIAINALAKPVIKELTGLVGQGEVECAGYAYALGVPIIISDNYTEFKWFENSYIMLTHKNLLTLCVKLKRLTRTEAEQIYNDINSTLDHPSSWDFNRAYENSLEIFNTYGWNEYLKV